jgi:hypothetical protein
MTQIPVHDTAVIPGIPAKFHLTDDSVVIVFTQRIITVFHDVTPRDTDDWLTGAVMRWLYDDGNVNYFKDDAGLDYDGWLDYARSRRDRWGLYYRAAGLSLYLADLLTDSQNVNLLDLIMRRPARPGTRKTVDGMNHLDALRRMGAINNNALGILTEIQAKAILERAGYRIANRKPGR